MKQLGLSNKWFKSQFIRGFIIVAYVGKMKDSNAASLSHPLIQSQKRFIMQLRRLAENNLMHMLYTFSRIHYLSQVFRFVSVIFLTSWNVRALNNHDILKSGNPK
jgi:hypothetical protein